MAVFFSHSPEETIHWAEHFAKSLKAGDTVLLEGDMGAGKTVLAKGIARGLGIEAEITSPTYAYINSYEKGAVRLFHFDCYRVTSERQAFELGFADCLEAGGICLVEWSENIRSLLPEHCLKVTIRGEGDGVREIGS